MLFFVRERASVCIKITFDSRAAIQVYSYCVVVDKVTYK